MSVPDRKNPAARRQHAVALAYTAGDPAPTVVATPVSWPE